ncbi:disease resistance protein RPV1-like [Gastrolobium bilobum]|uniref:disease resistance protein RPV1-like n=1 Tax=Gastrolobium bilobum TaxID=150636 RepID=UPI002AAF4A86|nr:disease resistance protein RPV1-like [Gastrolobium bilobum]
MSSSSSNRQWVYDVFLSFRGEDTCSGFVSHLQNTFSRSGINTYIDYNLEKGTELGPELLRAIEGSHISLVVFSQNYADSSWCLNELTKIMECHRTYGQVILPIFYDVDPSHVRHQKGAIEKAFEKFSDKNYSQEVLSSWKSALTQAANISGWDMRNRRSEAEVLERIVHSVLRQVNNTFLSITDFPVGLESRVQEVVGLIENQSSKVCVVGIRGMGGSGKTTTAKAIYNQIHRRFVNRSFIENISEVCQQDRRGQIDLQEQLLLDVLRTEVNIHSIRMGTTLIEESLCGKRALVVFDDVSAFQQLEALCGNRELFGEGSVIIITTRDMRLLTQFEVDYVYEMKPNNENESLELFSWHAFRDASPREDLIELSQNIVAYCGGLPLALEVLGSCLFGRTKQEWESVLSKLEIIPNDRVLQKLRISFDGLRDQMERDIFLNICCFFIGKDRAYC